MDKLEFCSWCYAILNHIDWVFTAYQCNELASQAWPLVLNSMYSLHSFVLWPARGEINVFISLALRMLFLIMLTKYYNNNISSAVAGSTANTLSIVPKSFLEMSEILGHQYLNNLKIHESQDIQVQGPDQCCSKFISNIIHIQSSSFPPRFAFLNAYRHCQAVISLVFILICGQLYDNGTHHVTPNSWGWTLDCILALLNVAFPDTR